MVEMQISHIPISQKRNLRGFKLTSGKGVYYIKLVVTPEV